MRTSAFHHATTDQIANPSLPYFDLEGQACHQCGVTHLPGESCAVQFSVGDAEIGDSVKEYAACFSDTFDAFAPSVIFTEVCNRMEHDRKWLNSKQMTKGCLLFRYFGNNVQRLKDLLEYENILQECLVATGILVQN